MRRTLALLIFAACAAPHPARAAAPAGGFLDRYRLEATPSDRLVTAVDRARLRVVKQYTYRRIESGAAAGGQDVELAFVMDSASPWSGSEAGRRFFLSELDKTASILERCSVRVAAVHVAEVWLSDPLRRSLTMDAASPYDPPAEIGVMTALSAPLRPLTLLIGDGYTHVYNRTATDGAVRQHPSARALRDVVAISWQVAGDYETRFRTQPGFSLVAHELVHVLGNVEHVNTPEPNLMNIYDGATSEESGRAKSGDLAPFQCDAVRGYPARP